MKIVTGARGEAHITSNDDQGLHQGIFGEGNYILNVGEKFAAELTDANTVSISDGEGVLQGVHFRVLPGTVDTVTIDSGTSGYNRIDLICARYTKDADTGIENVEWAVIKGTPSDSTPSAPAYTEGDILGGDLLAEFPIYKVTLTGITPVITSIMPMIVGEQRVEAKLDQTLAQSDVQSFKFFESVGRGVYWLEVSGTRLPSGEWDMEVYTMPSPGLAIRIARITGLSGGHQVATMVPLFYDNSYINVWIKNEASLNQTYDIHAYLTKVM